MKLLTSLCFALIIIAPQLNDSQTTRLKTVFTEDWDNWEIKGDNLSKYDPALQAAILFIPIFTSSIYLRGIIK